MAPTYACWGEVFGIRSLLIEWHAPPGVIGNEISVTRDCERQFCNFSVTSAHPSSGSERFFLSVNPSIFYPDVEIVS